MQKRKKYFKRVMNINEVLFGCSVLSVVLYFYFYPIFNSEKYNFIINIVLFVNGILLVIFNTNFINFKNNFRKISIFIVMIIESYTIYKIFYYCNIGIIIYFKILLTLSLIVFTYILFLIIFKFRFILIYVSKYNI